MRLQSQDQHKVDGGCPSGRGMCKQCRKLAASVLMQAETFSTLSMGRHLVLGEMCRGLSLDVPRASSWGSEYRTSKDMDEKVSKWAAPEGYGIVEKGAWSS